MGENDIEFGIVSRQNSLTSGEQTYLGDEHQDTLPALEVDGGSGCIAPSVDTARSGNYAPLSRPLYIYVKRSSLEHAEVADFVRYMLDNEAAIAERARFVPLDDSQLADTKQKLEGVLA